MPRPGVQRKRAVAALSQAGSASARHQAHTRTLYSIHCFNDVPILMTICEQFLKLYQR